jgi:hypothetical protein
MGLIILTIYIAKLISHRPLEGNIKNVMVYEPIL